MNRSKLITTTALATVMSASAAFWNAHAFNSEVASAIVERGLPHSPEFSHDMDLPVSASYYFGKDGFYWQGF